jgi:dsRNA-specific ribonuclease
MPGRLSSFTTPDAKVSECERILDYTFTNKHLILEALQMQGSMLNSGAPVFFDGKWLNIPLNKKLASHGDTVFDCIVNSLWVRRRATGTFVLSFSFPLCPFTFHLL